MGAGSYPADQLVKGMFLPLCCTQVLTNAVIGSLDVARTFEESAERAYAAMLKVHVL